MKLTTRTKLVLLAFVVIGVTMLVTVKYTSACRLGRVTLNDASLANWAAKYGLDGSSPLISQPVDSLAGALLARRSIFKVDISYNLPGELDIRTNNFKPVSFLVDRRSGQMFGVLASGRVVDLNNCEVDWEHPVLTSVSAGQLFGYSEDARVNIVVKQLQKIRQKAVDLYRLIDEVDFGNSNFLKVSIDGLPYRLKCRAETLAADLHKFMEFVSKFNPDLSDVTLMDLRFDDMVICARGKN